MMCWNAACVLRESNLEVGQLLTRDCRVVPLVAINTAVAVAGDIACVRLFHSCMCPTAGLLA